MYLFDLAVNRHDKARKENYLDLLELSFREIGNAWAVFRGVNPGGWRHSRLAFLSDKAGKTRVVAIGDL